MRNSKRERTLATLMCLVALGCPKNSDSKPPQANPPIESVVDNAWLTCDECRNDEAEKVRQLGERALPALKEVLAKGPPPAVVEAERRALDKRYEQLEKVSKVRPDLKPKMSKEQLINLYLGAQENVYKVRSAQSLGDIGGPEAKAALEEALANPDQSEEVKKAVREQLDRLSCAQQLADPQLVAGGYEHYTTPDGEFSRYNLAVANRTAYAPELWTPAPDLPPCGQNTESSRTWVEIFSGVGQRVYGFCALTDSAQLDEIWFAVRRGEPPPNGVYIELQDRRCSKTYRSNIVEITPAEP